MIYLQSDHGMVDQMADQRPPSRTSATANVNYLLLCLHSLTTCGWCFRANHRQSLTTAATVLKKQLPFLAIPSAPIKRFLQSLSVLFLLTLVMGQAGIAKQQDTLRVQVEQDHERALQAYDREDTESGGDAVVGLVERRAEEASA